MRFTREHFEAMLRGGEPMPPWIEAPLSIVSLVNCAGMAIRLARAPVRVDARVVSFGNITLGGTGKTPAVIERAQRELDAGHKPAVLTRGYFSERTKEPLLLAPGEVWRAPSPKAAAIARRFGDEAALIAWRVPGCAVVKGGDRVASAKLAIEELGCDVLLLDDGFQYVRLARDENVLVIDATCPVGNERVFPAGYLREPKSAARRATHVILTRCDQVDYVEELEGAVRTLCPEVPIRKTLHRPTRLVRLSDGAFENLDWLRGREVQPICGVANPFAFRESLASLGAIAREGIFLRDHARPEIPAGKNNVALVMTEKDAVKLDGPLDNAYALRIDLADWSGERSNMRGD